MSVFPKKIFRTHCDKLAIEWTDNHVSKYSLRKLRENCPCAHCRHEWTGEKLVKESDIQDDIHPLVVRNVGKYAMNIQWSDGHSSGIYTYETLRTIS